MRLLAECYEAAGGVPHVLLADRMGCLKGGVVANVVVPTAEYVRFATHSGSVPTSARRPTPSPRASSRRCRYARYDLVIPSGGWEDEAAATADARA